MGRNIVFYRTKTGKCPVEEFLNSLPPKEAQKVAWVLRLIQELDKVPSQFFKKLTDSEEIWECRIHIRSKAYRIFSFFFDGEGFMGLEQFCDFAFGVIKITKTSGKRRTGLDTGGQSTLFQPVGAEVALDDRPRFISSLFEPFIGRQWAIFIIGIQRRQQGSASIGTSDNTGTATNAFLLVDQNNPILLLETRLCWTDLHTLWLLAVHA